jgi:hypothetical protein
VFVKFKIINNFKQNIDETQQNNQKFKGKNPYQPMDFKNLKKKIREPKVSRLLPNVGDFQKNHTLGYGFKKGGQPDSPSSHTDPHHARHAGQHSMHREQ